MYIKFDDTSFYRYKNMTVGLQNLKWVTWPGQLPLCGRFVIRRLVNLRTKFEISIFTHYAVKNGDAKYRKKGGCGSVVAEGHC